MTCNFCGNRIPERLLACPTCLTKPPHYPLHWTALSLIQPWASLIVGGKKQYETRSWDTTRRGWVAIHASKKFGSDERTIADSTYYRDSLAELGFHGPYYEDVPRAAIVGVANLVQTYRATEVNVSRKEYSFGNYEAGRFAWLFSHPVMLKTPIPCRGALQFWRTPHDVSVELHRQLKEMSHLGQVSA